MKNFTLTIPEIMVLRNNDIDQYFDSTREDMVLLKSNIKKMLPELGMAGTAILCNCLKRLDKAIEDYNHE